MYQFISFPMSQFNFIQNTFDKVRITFLGTAAVAQQWDDVRFQADALPVNTGNFVESVRGVFGKNVDFAVGDTLEMDGDSSNYLLKDRRTGLTLGSVPTLLTYARYDTCFVIDTLDVRTFAISLNPYCQGSGGGSTDTTSLSNRIDQKVNISDTAAMLSPYKTSYPRQAVSLVFTTTGSSGAATGTYNNGTGVFTFNVPQYSGGGTGITSIVPGTSNVTVDATDPANPILSVSTAIATVTEQTIHYREEYEANKQINTGTGAITTNTGTAISGYLHVSGSTSYTIYVASGYSNVTIYGWTYDTSLVAISEIRSNALISTGLRTYTFTTPSNARFLNVYVKYNGLDFAKALNIKSTDSITYAVPIKPEQFAGTKSAPIQAALNFARFTSNGVELTGTYFIDSSLILSSGSTLILRNARLILDSASKTNVIRNEAVANPSRIFDRGNRNVKVIGLGNAIIEGSVAAWGGGAATGVGNEYWRATSFLFANVQDFQISGVRFVNTNMWALCFEQSRIGTIRDLEIWADSSHSNQDGINIRRGSRSITIENIKGRVWDDIVAMTNLKSYPQYNILDSTKFYDPYSTNLDIKNIIIKNIQRDTAGVFSPPFVAPVPFFKSGILLLCEDSLKIHDITIDGITGPQQIQIQVPLTLANYVSTVSATVNDVYNISVSNTNNARINFGKPIKNSSFVNIGDTTNTGAVNAVFLAGSKSLYRKYYNDNPDYFDTVTSAGNIYTDIAGSRANEGLHVINKLSTGISDIILESSVGNYAALRQYGSSGTYGPDGYSANTALLSSKSLIFATDASLGSGGTGTIDFRTGGGNLTQSRMIIGSTGLVGIGKTPSTRLDIQANNASFDGINVTNATSSGSATVNVTNNSGTVGFFRTYGSTFVLSYLQNKTAFGSNGSISIFPDAAVGSGGSNLTTIFGGGTDANQERVRIGATGMAVGTQANATSVLQTTSFSTAYTATATSISLTTVHNVVDVTATGQTITLPTAASITGREYTIKLTGAGTGTVATTSSQTIDGSTTYSLSAQYKYVTVKSTGSNWIIIANN